MKAKIDFYGLGGKDLNWFKSNLENSLRYCKLNGKISKKEVVICGVPQGSCLGPFLFLMYINDIPNCLEKSNVSMYADETRLYHSVDSVNAMTHAINADSTAFKGLTRRQQIVVKRCKNRINDDWKQRKATQDRYSCRP